MVSRLLRPCCSPTKRRFDGDEALSVLSSLLWGRLSSVLSTQPDSPKIKPDGLVYSTNELPPLGVLAISVSQHTALIMILICIYAVITAQALGFDAQDSIRYASTCIFCFGLQAVLQGLRSRFTPGLLIINQPGPVALATLVVIVTTWGPGAAIGAILVTNVIIFLLAPFLPRMRGYFPPEIVGVAVFMIGVTIIPGAVERSLAPSQDGSASLSAMAVSLLTLLGILAATVWGNERVRLSALFIGVALGTLAVLAFGAFNTDGLALLHSTRLFALPLPSPAFAMPVFVPGAILAYLIVDLVHTMDQIASAMTMDKLTDKKWVRADIHAVSRSVTALAIGNFINGAMGAVSGSSSTANIGLGHASGVLSRFVAIGTGFFMMVLAFVPAVPLLIVIMPLPVIGGILIYTAAFMIISGMELILSRMMNAKRSFTVGFSVVVGITILLLPELPQNLPEWSQVIAGSALSLALVTAIALNALFRIGVARAITVELGAPQDRARDASEMLEHWGAEWGARRDVVIRAGIAVGEALELLENSKLIDGQPQLTVRFDEVNLHCTLIYQGRPPPLDVVTIDIETLLNADDTQFETGLNNVSATLILRLADRVSVRQTADTARLLLEFNH